MVVGSGGNSYGYKQGSFGSLKPDTYKGIKIKGIYSTEQPGYGDEITWDHITSSIIFECDDMSKSKLPNPLIMKINGIRSKFYRGWDSCKYIDRGAITGKKGTYTIEFLN